MNQSYVAAFKVYAVDAAKNISYMSLRYISPNYEKTGVTNDEADPPQQLQPDNTEKGKMIFFIFGLVVLLCLMIVWFFIRYMKKPIKHYWTPIKHYWQEINLKKEMDVTKPGDNVNNVEPDHNRDNKEKMKVIKPGGKVNNVEPDHNRDNKEKMKVIKPGDNVNNVEPDHNRDNSAGPSNVKKAVTIKPKSNKPVWKH